MAKEAGKLGQQALNSTVQIGKQGADVSRAFMDDLGRSLHTGPNVAFAGGVGDVNSYLKAESRADGVGKVSGDKESYLNMLSGRGSGVKDAVNGEQDDYFIGTLKGQEIHLKGVKLEEIIYTKRSPEETAKLRKEFNSTVRKKFLKEFATDPIRVEYLKEAGLVAVDIARMQDGLNPKGWQVHHNLPLDDGGTNDFANLVLINNDPYHKAVTNEQNTLTRGLAPKQSITINWPMFKDEIYPPKPFEGGKE
ncbi:HNH endonuclease [Niallia taxi]|uniref:HNH endonuclease signature motif containing protein n=1 Tax=Niallia taxi TaxID=2499688 RepID=UPI0029348D02|nr:HNH endonuclease signature motif containing protein [Niallia taxi]WOD63546.1 HNH endonuclease [Niallia taxi]